MDSDTFLLKTAPYMIRVAPCDGEHLHIFGGFVSEVPVDEEEFLGSTPLIEINQVTGEVFRAANELIVSLN